MKCKTSAAANHMPNQVECLFAMIIDKKIKRGLEELEATINAFPEQHNAAPKPVQVVKSADDSLAAIERFCVYNTPA
jgi:hypothetical protein